MCLVTPVTLTFLWLVFSFSPPGFALGPRLRSFPGEHTGVIAHLQPCMSSHCLVPTWEFTWSWGFKILTCCFSRALWAGNGDAPLPVGPA